jgi:hypothetical protein
MSDELEVDYVEQEVVEVPDEEVQWSHEVLMQFELLIDSLGIETVMFLLDKEHEDIINSWVKDKVDISNRTKQ